VKLETKHSEAITHVSQIVAYAVVEKGMENKGEQRRTKVSFDRITVQALELLRLAKRHISGWSNVKQ